MENKDGEPTLDDLRKCIIHPLHILTPVFNNVYDSNILCLLNHVEKKQLVNSLYKWIMSSYSLYRGTNKMFKPPHGLKVAQIFINDANYYINMKSNIYGLKTIYAMESKEYNKKIYLLGENHNQFLMQSRRIANWLGRYVKKTNKVIDIFLETWYTHFKIDRSDYLSNLHLIHDELVDCFKEKYNCPFNIRAHYSDIRHIDKTIPYVIYMKKYLNNVRQHDSNNLYNIFMEGYETLFSSESQYKSHIAIFFDRVELDNLIELIPIYKNKVKDLIETYIYNNIKQLYHPVNEFEKIKETPSDINALKSLGDKLVAIYSAISDVYCVVNCLRVYENGYTPHYIFSIWGANHIYRQSNMLSDLGFTNVYSYDIGYSIPNDAGVMIPFSEEEPFEWGPALSRTRSNKRETLFNYADVSSISQDPTLLCDDRFKHVHDAPENLFMDPFVNETLLKNLSIYLEENKNPHINQHKRFKSYNFGSSFNYSLAIATMMHNHLYFKINPKPESLLILNNIYYATTPQNHKFIYLLDLDDLNENQNNALIIQWFEQYFNYTDKLIDIFAHIWVQPKFHDKNKAMSLFYNIFSSCFSYHKISCKYKNIRMHYTNVLDYLLDRKNIHGDMNIVGQDTLTEMRIFKFLLLIVECSEYKQKIPNAELKQALIQFIQENKSYINNNDFYHDLLYLFTRNKTFKQAIDMPYYINYIGNFIDQQLSKYNDDILISMIQNNDYTFVPKYITLFTLCNVIYTISRMWRNFADGTTCKYAFILTSTEYIPIMTTFLTEHLSFKVNRISSLNIQYVFPSN